MRLTTLAILLPIALTTAFPIAPAMVQIIKPHSPRAAEAVAEAIVGPPSHHSGAVNVPLPPRDAIAPAMVFILPQSKQHSEQHPPRAAEAVAEAIVDSPPHHSGAVNVPLPPRDAVKRSALAKVVCPYLSGHRYCQQPPSTRDDDARGATIYKIPNLQGENTSLPANNYCTDMTNIFGDFNNNVRGLIMEKGVKCIFYK